MSNEYDIIVFGAGIAGLYTANCLQKAGYSVLVVEKDTIGGVQTLASQGMIHGGQKYVLEGKMTAQGFSSASMVSRWEDCFAGKGDVDLSEVKTLSDTQVMFPAGSVLSNMAVFAAAQVVNGETHKLNKKDIPPYVKREPVYQMNEKVLDVKSLVEVLAKDLTIVKGDMQSVSSDGAAVISGVEFKVKKLIFTAGKGNEEMMAAMVDGKRTQRRPLRQVMVKPMDTPLYGHGIVESPKPRVTVTAHPIEDNKYVWYLGGNIAEKSVSLTEEAAIAFAKKEMRDIFPDINWDDKEWASWEGDRAEPFNEKGSLPPGAYVYAQDNMLVAWPTKLTFAPDLSDKILEAVKDIQPSVNDNVSTLPKAQIGKHPWEVATWRKI